jgi:aryl-alcohol dehydrogenase-like predicted oxidoreductase
VDLQIEYSLISRGPEDEILGVLRDLGIGVTAYGVLSRGLIGGHMQTVSAPGDYRSFSPRFQGDALQHNLALTESLRVAGQALGMTPAQAAIAWVLAKGEDIVPLVGARRRDRLTEALSALDAVMTPDAVAALERAVPKDAAAGERYPAAQMASLDSERRGA